MSKLGDQPAFPRPIGAYRDEEQRSIIVSKSQEGMTLRMHYAGLALAGLLADHKDHYEERRSHYETPKGERCDQVYTGPRKRVYDETCAQCTARLAVEHADALIAELEKKSP